MDSRKQMNGHKIRAINRKGLVSIYNGFIFLTLLLTCFVFTDMAYGQSLIEEVTDTETNIEVSMLIDASKGEKVEVYYGGIGGFGSETVEESQLSGAPIDPSKITVASPNDKGEGSFTFRLGEDGKPSTFLFDFGKIIDRYQEGFIQWYVNGKQIKELTFDTVNTEEERIKRIERNIAEDETSKEEEPRKMEEPTARSLLSMTDLPSSKVQGKKLVANWKDFLAALSDKTIHLIELGTDITIDDRLDRLRLDRNLTINGNGHHFDFTGTTNRSIGIDSVSVPTQLVIKNLSYSGSNTTAILNGSSGDNWHVILDNVSSEGSDYVRRPLLHLPNSQVTMTGSNTFNYTGGASFISAGDLNISGELTYNSEARYPFYHSTSGNVSADSGTNIYYSSSDYRGNFISSSEALNVDLSNTAIHKGASNQQAGYFIEGSSSVKLMVNNDSPIDWEFGSINGLVDSGRGFKVEMKHLNLIMDSHDSNVFNMSGTAPVFHFSNGMIQVKDTEAATSFIETGVPDSEITFNQSEIYHKNDSRTSVRGTFFSATNAAANSELNLMETRLVASSFNEATGEGENRRLSGGGSVINVGTNDTGCPNFTLNMRGKKSDVILEGGSTQTGSNGGIISISGAGGEFFVSDKASLEVDSLQGTNATPAIVMQALKGGFYITEESEIILTSIGNSNNLSPTMRFRLVGDMTFEMDKGSKMEIKKSTDSNVTLPPGVRMYGENNEIFVKNGSEFIVHNKGGRRAEDGSGNTDNQGIYYTNGSNAAPNTFEVTGENSNVEITADLGPAIYSKEAIDIVAGTSTYMIARGRTSSSNEGIFAGSIVNVSLHRPKYYDFTNMRDGGGTVFSNSSGKLSSQDSTVAFWKVGTSVTGNPTQSFLTTDYFLSGANYGKIETGTSQEIRDFMTLNGSMVNMSRINGNNQAAQINQLRVPTNADTGIYAHAIVPEGRNDEPRDAFDDEVHTVLAVYDQQGKKIVEDIASSQAQQIHGATTKMGVIQLNLPKNISKYRDEFMTEGWKINVLEAWRGSPDKGEETNMVSLPSDIKVDETTTIDVTPPKTPRISHPVTNSTKQIMGTGDEPGAKVFIKVKNEWLLDNSGQLITTTVSDDGNWTLDLPRYVEKTDEVEVYLKDEVVIEGTHLTYTLPDSYTSEPNNVLGNLSVPYKEYQQGKGNYHDARDKKALYPATLKVVKDVLPDQPHAKKSYTSSGGETTQVGDTLTYQLTVKNDKESVVPTTWRDVIIRDYLPKEVVFDKERGNIKLNGMKLSEKEYTYDEEKHELLIPIGDLTSQETAKITFDTKVLVSAVGKEIMNIFDATGNSPREATFVPGPENEQHKKETYQAEADVKTTEVFGTVLLASAPEMFDFGKVEYRGKPVEKREAKNLAHQDKLVVSDSRANQSKWTVSVKVLEPLTSGNNMLTDAFRYRLNQQDERVLTSSETDIFVGKDGGSAVISDTWSKEGSGLGLYINEIELGNLGTYKGELLWTLKSAP